MSERHLSDREDLPLARALIASARADAPPPQSTARMLEALGVAAAASSLAAAGPAAQVKGAALVSTKWLLLLSTIVAAGLVTVVMLRPRTRAPAASAPPPPAASPSSSPAPTIVEAKEVVSVVPAPVPSPSIVAPKPSAVVRKPVKTAAPTLKDAVALIDAARDALAAHQPDDTIAALDRHDAEFPSGPLRPESTVLRAEALAMRGDRDAARTLAQKIVESMPGTANARRAQKILDNLP